DKGVIETTNGLLKVVDVKKTGKGLYVHTCTLEKGFVKAGDKAVAKVDVATRRATEANHSSAHLLQAALRKVLGDHVHQSGSYVDNERCRFDFTHFSAMTAEELAEVERLVNQAISDAQDVTTQEMSMEGAKKSGAIALFGEKYGDVVRVVKMGDFATELCGGTHVSNTAKVGLFKIVSESSVAAGVRRIEAVTGLGVLALLAEKQNLINETAKGLKINNPNDIAVKAAQASEEIKALQKENEALRGEIAKGRVADLMKNAVDVNGIKVYTGYFASTTPDALRQMAASIEDGIAVLCGEQNGKVTIAASCSKSAIAAGVKAGVLVKEVAAVTGGNGGGKPDFAMAGAKDVSKVDQALAKAPEIVKTILG
ncbi:MAG: alanine--tRNA ligase, partial [Oscillospiraceae bacterium]|nr:alanine--tRNA ligase [Oscillospiraceae bacterium]